MKFTFKPLIFAVAMASISSASALDLPIKRIQGRDYYIYNVKRGENIYDIAENLGITRSEIVKFNPGAADGVRMGNTLYLPVDEFAESNPAVSGMKTTGSGTVLRYKVEKGETLFGIAYKFGVTPDEIAELNPSANAGVHAGMMLDIPVSEEIAAKYSTTTDVPELKPQEARLTPVERKLVPVEEVEPAAETQTNVPELPEKEARLRPVEPGLVFAEPIDSNEIIQSSITLLLPLMIENRSVEPSRTQRSASDFARGFMMGLDADKALAKGLTVQMIDTEGRTENLSSLLNTDTLNATDIIIAPENINSLSDLLPVVNSNSAYLLNLFAVADTSYVNDPLVLQANIPASLMYEKAAETLLASYSDHMPVFLISKGGKGEKLPFTNYLRQQYASIGIEPIDLMYEGMLTSNEVADLDRDQKYVFIPASGSATEFNKFARTISGLRDEVSDPSSILLWGYPDWTAFRGENLEMLHHIGAIIYSRFFCDYNSPEVREFEKNFRDNYDIEPAEQVPSQAIMGYDTARYLVQNIRDNQGMYTPELQPLYRGLQNSYLFVTDTEDPEDHAGPVNNVLYIVTFLPGDKVSISVI